MYASTIRHCHSSHKREKGWCTAGLKGERGNQTCIIKPTETSPVVWKRIVRVNIDGEGLYIIYYWYYIPLTVYRIWILSGVQTIPQIISFASVPLPLVLFFASHSPMLLSDLSFCWTFTSVGPLLLLILRYLGFNAVLRCYWSYSMLLSVLFCSWSLASPPPPLLPFLVLCCWSFAFLGLILLLFCLCRCWSYTSLGLMLLLSCTAVCPIPLLVVHFPWSYAAVFLHWRLSHAAVITLGVSNATVGPALLCLPIMLLLLRFS